MLCDESDIVMLQETWLAKQELSILLTLHSEFYGRGVSSMNDADGINTGRPFGGLAILWRKSLGTCCTVENLDDTRLMLCKITNGAHTTSFLNVYLPCDSGDNLDDYSFYLSKVDSMLRDDTHTAAIGDFNANISHDHHRFGKELKSFCETENLTISDHLLCHKDTFTFYSEAHDTVAWLDHVISTTSFHSSIDSIWVDNTFVTSDHFPLFITISIENIMHDSATDKEEVHQKMRQPNWSKLSANDFCSYQILSSEAMTNIHLNHSLMLCDNTNCCDARHTAAIETLYSQIIDALSSAQDQLVEKKACSSRLYRQIPDWKEVCSEQYQQARDAFHLWSCSGKPKTGPLFHMMKISRANFKSLIRQCKMKSNVKESDILAHKLLSKDPNKFWTEIKKINGNEKRNPLPDTVDDKSGMRDVCTMWKEHFSKLLNTSNLDNSIDSEDYNVSGKFDFFTHNELLVAMNSLKTGKSAGNDGLAAEAFKYTDKKIIVYITMLFNCILCHGYIPTKLMDTIIVPIVKDKKGDLSSKDNYRPIALTTVMSKVLETLILNRYESLLLSKDSQFGFKQNHSTDLCIYTLKQTIDYYRSKSSPIYICFLDASKAFDRVNHGILLKKLINRNLPNIVIRILHVWYSCQCFYVKWGFRISSPFPATNGVRQGGILSPVLFNLYVDNLSEKLNSLDIGCYVNSVCYNHLIYADDTVLLAPSPKALQMLIDECITFANENCLIYNKTKTKCLCVKPKHMTKLFVPNFYLENFLITSVQQETYLGYILNDNMSDDDHIIKEMRNLYARGNMLIRYFKHCTDTVKIMLFKTFCTSLYCCPLWIKYKKSTLKKLHVACNKLFKHLMNVPRDFSASMLFVNCNVRNFPCLRRKLVYSFTNRVRKSSNILVDNFNSLTDCDSFRKSWNNVLRF